MAAEGGQTGLEEVLEGIGGCLKARGVLGILEMTHWLGSEGLKLLFSKGFCSEMGGLTEDDLARRYKVILSNPPYAGVLPKESIRKDLHTNAKKAEKAPDEDPAELIRETLAIERELENRLEKLLKDVEVAS